MSKLALAILTASAFLYAVWLVAAKRNLPDPGQSTGLGKRFLLATLLFAGMLALRTSAKDNDVRVTCYEVSIPDKIPAAAQFKAGVIPTIRAAWKALDPEKGEEFRKKLDACVKSSDMGADVSKMLALAYSELSFHKERTRGKEKMWTCYKMTPLGGALSQSRENAFEQIELLRKAREKGAIDADTEKKVLGTLAREIQMLSAAEEISGDKPDFERENILMQKYKKGELQPDKNAEAAAQVIVSIEKE